MADERRTIDSIHIKGFTAFTDLAMGFSPGINAIIGDNSTGKTHLLKYLHVMFGDSREQLVARLTNFLFPFGKDVDRLINYKRKRVQNYIVAGCGKQYKAVDCAAWEFAPNKWKTRWGTINEDFYGQNIPHEVLGEINRSRNPQQLMSEALQTIFIPASDILSHSPKFQSLYEQKEIHFDQTYYEILVKALGANAKSTSQEIEKIIGEIEIILGGKIDVRGNDDVFLDLPEYPLEIDLVADGYRKFALLWLLLKTGSIKPGTVLFWDEPEANLNPKLMIELVKILLMLEQMGVQIFFTTHDYIMLKYLDLLKTDKHKVRFHSLYRNEEGEIATDQADLLVGLEHNAIFDVFEDIFQREMKRAAERIKID